MSRPSEIARQIDEIVYHIKGKKVRIQKEREAIEQDKRERNELMKGRDKLEDEIEELKKKIDREQSRISKKEKELEEKLKASSPPSTNSNSVKVDDKKEKEKEEDMLTHLFNWMTLAIRLDSSSRGISHNSFDKTQVFTKLYHTEKIPYAAWPKHIMQEFDKQKK